MYKVEAGPAKKSFGVRCARLAGFPEDVVADAEKRVAALEGGSS